MPSINMTFLDLANAAWISPHQSHVSFVSKFICRQLHSITYQTIGVFLDKCFPDAKEVQVSIQVGMCLLLFSFCFIC